MTELTLEESLSMFMSKIEKRHDENTNLIKELRASTDFALRTQKASIKALEIQVRRMSNILHERLSGNLQSSIKIKPRVNDETISTSVKVNKPSIHCINASQYVVSNLQNKNLFSMSNKTTLPSSNRLDDNYWDELKETNGEKDLEAHCTNAKTLGKAFPQKEKDPGSFTLPCFINNMCFNRALDDLGASVSVMPYSTYTTLGLGDLIPTKLIVELADRTVKRPKGIVENVLVDLLERRKHGLEARLMGNTLNKNRSHDPKFDDYIELSDLSEPLELRHDQAVDLGPTIKEGKDYIELSDLSEPLELRHDQAVDLGPTIKEDFAVTEDMDRYCDEEIGDVIVGKEFCK
nr:hypothetical protein [Tanacetum cinerariifolium]